MLSVVRTVRSQILVQNCQKSCNSKYFDLPVIYLFVLSVFVRYIVLCNSSVANSKKLCCFYFIFIFVNLNIVLKV